MKKSILFLVILGALVACDNNIVNNNSNNSNTDDTTSDSIVNNDDNRTEVDSRIQIDPNECYMIQEFNELGEPVESYKCILFEKNAGRTFEDAFNNIKSDLDALVNRMVIDEQDGGSYDASKWELRQLIRNVTNPPAESLEYTSIELYIFSNVYNAYVVVYQFCVIDSEGNLYQIASLAD